MVSLYTIGSQRLGGDDRRLRRGRRHRRRLPRGRRPAVHHRRPRRARAAVRRGVGLGLYVGTRRAGCARREARGGRGAAADRQRAARRRRPQGLADGGPGAGARGDRGRRARRARRPTAIADLGRQTMGEMHRTLKLLRARRRGPRELAPQPGLGELPDAGRRARAARASGSSSRSRARRARSRRASTCPPTGSCRRRSPTSSGTRTARTRTVTLALRPGRARAHDRRRRERRAVARRARAATGWSGCASGPRCSAARSTAGPRDGRGFEVRAALPYGGASMSRLRVVIADDQPLMRAASRRCSRRPGHRGGRRGGERRGGGRGRRARTAPDVVLMDIRMPGHGRHRGDARGCRASACSILTTFGLDEYIVEALRAGASGFLLKDAPTARAGRRGARGRRRRRRARPGRDPPAARPGRPAPARRAVAARPTRSPS